MTLFCPENETLIENTLPEEEAKPLSPKKK